MSKRVVKHVSDMEIDEISLVDRPANQHALVTIAKRRAPEEDAVPDNEMYYDANGDVVDPTNLEFGDHVFDAEGIEYVLEPPDEDEEDKEKELAGAGVSKAFESDEDDGDELSKSILDDLAKAVTESDKNEIIAKALARQNELSKRLEAAEELAKRERTIRLEREYIAKAAEYNVPVAAEDLGPVLMRMAETLSYDDCKVIHKALTAAGEMLFEEAGYQGQADNLDPLSQVEAIIEQSVSKSADAKVSKAAAMEHFFDQNPGAYDEYVRGIKG